MAEQARYKKRVKAGIHYVIGCRNVDEECEAHPEHVARRRAESEVNEAARMANLALPNNNNN